MICNLYINAREVVLISACGCAILHSGVDVEPFLRWLGAGERIIAFYTMPAIGNAAVAYLFYKLATPLRYPVTIAGTHLAVKGLRRWGYMQTPSEEHSLRSFVGEGRTRAKEKYELYQDKMEDMRDELKEELKERKEGIKEQLKERRTRAKERYELYQDKMEDIRDELKEELKERKEQLKERREELKEHLKERRDELKEQLQERKWPKEEIK